MVGGILFPFSKLRNSYYIINQFIRKVKNFFRHFATVPELSSSGTAFMTGAATYFHDRSIRKDILRTAEIAGHSVRHDGKQHYLLANVALVGESIMLAMRTHFK